MDNFLVSVVIPTHERPEFLKRAVNSVIKQDYDNIEIIIVIDGMSAVTKEVVNDLNIQSNRKIIVEETGEKVGGSEARNIGVNLSSGDYIALLDDDDEWLEKKISLQIEMIKENKLTPDDYFICYTSILTYKDINQRKYKKYPRVNYSETSKKNIIEYLFTPRIIFTEGFIQTSTIMVPKKLIQEIPFTKGLPKHQDWDWLLSFDISHDLSILQVNSPQVIYHSDVPKRIGRQNQWRFSEEWIDSKKNQLGYRAYDTLMLNLIVSNIKKDSNLSRNMKIHETLRCLKKVHWKSYFHPYTIKSLLYLFRT
ncbi:glycosyltransferase family 2 protein [Marinilactibacillus psychrotolerans]|uniref:glycosyltransferase family 2 protein n=1 Tax=Marinilactibacillus psychrotolerans TaxID=191770 RepID=UPI001867FA21|nr:glycosyltransferase family 2 protein [Marinilactibacillus psychrotolerans]